MMARSCDYMDANRRIFHKDYSFSDDWRRAARRPLPGAPEHATFPPIACHRFMMKFRPFLAPALGLAAGFQAFSALADGGIGVVRPADGPYLRLGQQIEAGVAAEFAAAGTEAGAPVLVDEGCAEGAGTAAANRLVEAKVAVAIGFLCTDTLEEALPVLAAAGIPAITLSSRSGPLAEDAKKQNWPFFRLAPGPGRELDFLKRVLTEDWQGLGVAIVDDGSIPQREIAEALRNAMEERGMRPLMTETLRPGQDKQLALARQIARSGATHVLVAAERSDVAVLARDANSDSLDLTFLGTSALEAADGPVPLPIGVRAALPADPADNPANAALVATLRKRGVEPEGYVLPAYAASAMARAAAAAALQRGEPVAAVLKADSFSTVIGPIRFDAAGERSDNPFRLGEWNGKRFDAPAALTP